MRKAKRKTITVSVPGWALYLGGGLALAGIGLLIRRERSRSALLDPLASFFGGVFDPVKRLFRSDSENDVRDSFGLGSDIETLKKDFEMLR